MARDSDVYEVKLRLYPIGADPESSLGQLLMDAAYSSEAFSDWAAMLAWNLTIAALLCQVARAERTRCAMKLAIAKVKA